VIGLPTIVGRNGAAGQLEPSMSEHERRVLERSAATLRDAARRIGVLSAMHGGAPAH
jgi:malate/lactate dehydrogenase